MRFCYTIPIPVTAGTLRPTFALKPSTLSRMTTAKLPRQGERPSNRGRQRDPQLRLPDHHPEEHPRRRDGQ